jgi:(1->4)-alpha-D-glucan 1-alpha-D-glucosylmutase
MNSTYRLQLRNGVTFFTAAEFVPYLADLGISDLYVSPIFEAEPGSVHGYDVIDLNRLDPTLGGDEGFAALTSALQRYGLGLVVDFVPNHMAASPHNGWWKDVLEWGASSRYAQHFDIDWSAPRLLLPILASSYGDLLAAGAFSLHYEPEKGDISFTYGDLHLPLHPASCAGILAQVAREDCQQLSRELVFASPGNGADRKRKFRLLASEANAVAAIRKVIDAVAVDVEALHALHERQIWRLCDWQIGREALTYRRFFEITGLVGIRVEREDVFRDVHDRLLQLVANGDVTGLRIDHVDGLADPAGYLDRLHSEVKNRTEATVPILVEKILGPNETIPTNWPVAGTTGYEFTNAVTSLLVDPEGKRGLTSGYRAFLGNRMQFEIVVDLCKRQIITHNLHAEFARLTELAQAIAANHRSFRDLGRETLRAGIAEIAIAFPIYRTYVDVRGVGANDRAVIRNVVASARIRREVENEAVFDFLEKVLLLDFPTPETQAAALDFTQRFQQTTGPVMAKALEDTAFYRYNRLIALNEVGGNPDAFGGTAEHFHQAMMERVKYQPQGLSATATHDTKRGEDARARLCVLSEAPNKWTEHVTRWRSLNRHLKTAAGKGSLPDPNVEWLFYQTLFGAWPVDMDANDEAALASLSERISAFMRKAVREAKQHTSWTKPDKVYETALEHFVRGVLHRDTSPAFLSDFGHSIEPFVRAGAVNSMAQALVKLTAPGVPDIYQRTETWDLSLVDPDNRKPVVVGDARDLLERQSKTASNALFADWRAGLSKLHVITHSLALRRARPQLFAEGEYRQIRLDGVRAENIVAYARTHREDAALVVVPRLAFDLLDGTNESVIPTTAWRGTYLELPDDLSGFRWRNVLADNRPISTEDRRLEITQILDGIPIALLVPPSLRVP